MYGKHLKGALDYYCFPTSVSPSCLLEKQLYFSVHCMLTLIFLILLVCLETPRDDELRGTF